MAPDHDGDMLAGLGALHDMVCMLAEDVARLAGAAEAAPRLRLMAAAETIVFLRRGLSSAIAGGSPDQWRAAACRTSGLRKGLAELGLFDHARDRATIDPVDRATDLALRLCLS